MAVKNLAELAEESADRLGERSIYEVEGERFTNWQLLDRSHRLHGALIDLGHKRGAKVTVVMTNNALVFPVMQGVMRCGGTTLPLIPQSAPSELHYVFADAEVQFVVTDRDRLPAVREAVAGLRHVRAILVAGGADRSDASLPELRLDSLLETASRAALPQIAPEDIALMLYSSGTTGRAKGVLLSHANLLACAASFADAAELQSWEGPRIMVSAMPIGHMYGVVMMNDLLMTPKHLAEQTRLVQIRWFDPERVMALIQQHRATGTAAVPTILALLLHHPRASEYDLSSLKEILCGGAPLRVELAQAFMRRYPVRIREAYGLTESSGLGSINRRTEPHRPGSAGRAYRDVELQIVDEQDRPLKAFERGEICIRGPVVMRGYHNRPEDTAQILRGGWLYSGDIGYLDDEGYLFVVDRMKDTIIRGGENIYPAEIEAVLHQHPEVAEAAVVGVPDEIYGENVVAFIIVKPDSKLRQDEVIEHVCRQVARFKAPTRVHFVAALPKSNIGKVLRRVLREQAKATL